MPKINAIATAVPPYKVSRDQARDFVAHLFKGKISGLERLLTVFENAGIDSRYVSKPVEWFAESHSLSEKNQAYIESATQLTEQVTNAALDQAGLDVTDIDYVIYVNTTGLATPSIDARLINSLGFRRDVRRTPIWGLGCAGGAAGLSHAYHHAIGHPRDRVLVVACELCGLTFMPGDYSRSNLVASALFAEGAAAVLVTGDEADGSGAEIIGTNSRFYPDSLDVMGWNVVDQGLQVVFAQRIPDIVERYIADDFMDFLARHNMRLGDVDAFLLHPGGTKVIEAYQSALALQNGGMPHTQEILLEYGNMSSVTVLFVLERYLKNLDTSDEGRTALLSALGPGFCSESVLMRA